VDRESRPLNEAATRARTTQQWPPDREACTARRRERSERPQEPGSVGSANVADAGRTMRSFTSNGLMRLHSGTAPVGGGEHILVLLKELLYLSRDPSPGRSRQLEDSRRCGERRPFAAQAHSTAGHAITIRSRSPDRQAYQAGYSPLTLPSPRWGGSGVLGGTRCVSKGGHLRRWAYGVTPLHVRHASRTAQGQAPVLGS
jgi:hypothetical protein